MEKHESVPINYLRQIADQLADFGASIESWLAREGFREADLSDASVTIPVETFGALVADAVTQTGESGFGLLAGRRLMPSAHGVVGMATSASACIREAMEIVERYVALRTGVVSIYTRATPNTLEVCFEPALGLGKAGPVVVETAVVAVKNIADEKTLHNSACTMVSFAFPEPGHAQLARDILGCEVRYGQSWTGLSFPLPAAEQVASRRDALVLAEAMRICSNELKNLRVGTCVSAKVERLMLERKHSFPPLELCARLLGMTPRTLHRRLTDEGTSYSEVLDSVRRRIARECLEVEKLSVKEVAYLLGYNDVANFRRAFKRWEGVPPSRY
ncbi:AraC family transcriptional regulator [Burkholderia sp. F1]|uniref:AraC family transcriptional regulator n=1 Tax=Burkholderia sp. F1 TaxID=3366817 RepID=UPI003D752713